MINKINALKILLTIAITTTCVAQINITDNSYQPSGCVEATFKINEEGNAYDINFDKHYPENMFLEQAYTNITSMKHTPTKKNNTKSIFLQFQSDKSWPLPFECLQTNNKTNEKTKINNQFLSTKPFTEIKKAIDKEFFQSIYDSITVTHDKPVITINKNNKADVTVNLTWNFEGDKANHLTKHYFNPIYASSKNSKVKSFEILRKAPSQTKNINYRDELLNYIGQRLLIITVNINDHQQEIIVGAPLSGNTFCSGKIAKREGFDKYCITYQNNQGHKINFNNLNKDITNNLNIYTEFRISNSYLSTLPKQTNLTE